MSRREVYSCEECGAERKEANHWWMVHRSIDGCVFIETWPKHDSGTLATAFHYCGQQCAIAAISRFMGTGKLEK